jgi:GNAT superfamily N-acetyltransferase
MIRRLDPSLDADACDSIVQGLPAWFGDADGIARCARAVRTQDGLVAVEDGEIVAFITHEPLPGFEHEITWMAVRADRRRNGIGTALVAELLDRLPAGTRSLLVKTLSDRDGDPGPEYFQTRGFYLARGFTPVAELDIWGPENPCQVLARPLSA